MTIFDDIRGHAEAILDGATVAEGMYITAQEERDALAAAYDDVVRQLAAMRAERDAARDLAQILQVQLDDCRAGNPDPDPDPDPEPAQPLIGMSAPASLWSTRLNEVGPGVEARRIFAGNDANDPWDDQIELVEQALADGMLPVFSTKLGRDIGAVLNGSKDADAQRLADKLASYGKTIAVAFWHEPNPDITGAQFVAANTRLAAMFSRGNLMFGPLLNGWLLDNQQSTFTSFTSPGLLATWDFFGIDTYEQGTPEAPGKTKPVDRMPKLLTWMEQHAAGDLPIVVGEYNGYSAKSITDMGEWLLSHPTYVWTGCMWNADGGKGRVLTGDRLAAYTATLQDPRAAEYQG